MEIKAKRVHYDGIYFRSTIEARWAFLFNLAGIDFRYEPQLYKLHYKDKEFGYIPDFYIPQDDLFIEVKGKYPNKVEIAKAGLLAMAEKKYVIVLAGGIPYPPTIPCEGFNTMSFSPEGSIEKDKAWFFDSKDKGLWINPHLFPQYSVITKKMSTIFCVARKVKFDTRLTKQELIQNYSRKGEN